MSDAVQDVARVVVMGVAGAGKTTVGTLLAARLDAPFVDADSLHPPTNIDKMSVGTPLTDADRLPWLNRVRAELAGRDRVVVACSALRRAYRDVLRGPAEVTFVFLDLDETAARRRTRDREGHFMTEQMVTSQFAALERPAADEADVITFDAANPLSEVAESVVRALAHSD